jgi:fumarate reductase subunit C
MTAPARATTTSPAYTPHHPRWLRRRVSTYWWLARPTYLAFILRELSSVFIAWALVYLLLLVRAVGQDPDAYQRFLDGASHPLIVAINVVTLLFAVFHTVTWFNLAPQAMVVHLGTRRVPGALIAASNYAAWLAVSIGLAWLLVGR